jgi:nucleotide-binding universal stress UspA family protein
MSRNILVVFDGSDPSIRGLSYALTLVKKDTKLTILYIIDQERYEDIRASVERVGGGSKEVSKILDEAEVKFRKQVGEFIRMCRNIGGEAECLFRVGKVTEEILSEAVGGKYDMLVLPYCKAYEEKMEHIISEILKNYPGNILIVK